MADLKFEIIESFGELSTSKSGWHLELNFVQWGDNQPKFDLRTWAPDHKKMGKGLTLTHDELVNLNQLIQTVLEPETAVDEHLKDAVSEQAAINDVEDTTQPAWGKLNDF